MQALNTEEQDRRQDEHLRFLRMVREWADGGDTPPLVPAGHDEQVRKVIDDLTHAARHCKDEQDRVSKKGLHALAGYHMGEAHAYRDAISRLTEALR